MAKIICLGNEFLEIDSLAKKVGVLLKETYEIIDIKDSFQLMTVLQETPNPILLDVVKDLKEVQIIQQEKITSNAIISAHDFDVGYVLKLIGKDVKIIGIPMTGDAREIAEEVKKLVENNIQ
jgi:hypothetical protein